MSTRMSRRWFVAAIGGVAGAASATMVCRSRRGQTEQRQAAHVGDTLGFVDHDGWVLTPADQRRFIQGTNAPGSNDPSAGASPSRDR